LGEAKHTNKINLVLVFLPDFGGVQRLALINVLNLGTDGNTNWQYLNFRLELCISYLPFDKHQEQLSNKEKRRTKHKSLPPTKE